MSQHTNLISKVLNDSKTVTSKLYIMLKEHLLNLFYSIYEPSLDYSSFDTTQKSNSGNALCIFETNIIEVCFCEREILSKADQMNKKLFNIWFSSA